LVESYDQAVESNSSEYAEDVLDELRDDEVPAKAVPAAPSAIPNAATAAAPRITVLRLMSTVDLLVQRVTWSQPYLRTARRHRGQVGLCGSFESPTVGKEPVYC
jgi:hypothetical protein